MDITFRSGNLLDEKMVYDELEPSCRISTEMVRVDKTS
jgi:hypothetical protein